MRSDFFANKLSREEFPSLLKSKLGGVTAPRPSGKLSPFGSPASSPGHVKVVLFKLAVGRLKLVVSRSLRLIKDRVNFKPTHT